MNRFRGIWLIASVAVCAWAGSNETPASSKSKHSDNPLLQQRESVSTMRQSLQTQRQAIRKQLGQTPAQGFFRSPAPPPKFVASPPPACDPLAPSEVDSLVEDAAGREELDPELLRSVAQQESAFRPCAVSEKGPMGLMQLMPATAGELGVANPFDPQQNLDAGAHFLKQLLRMYNGDVGSALGAYNSGPSRVNEYGGIPLIPETMDYVQRVLMLLPALQ